MCAEKDLVIFHRKREGCGIIYLRGSKCSWSPIFSLTWIHRVCSCFFSIVLATKKSGFSTSISLLWNRRWYCNSSHSRAGSLIILMYMKPYYSQVVGRSMYLQEGFFRCWDTLPRGKTCYWVSFGALCEEDTSVLHWRWRIPLLYWPFAKPW